ncbi:hypothetical protein NY78_0617 [Desulfovibrio sp. TomC]|nr:hypothetical protein NY78_0617 [Desulfovibrio sp. TomC]
MSSPLAAGKSDRSRPDLRRAGLARCSKLYTPTLERCKICSPSIGVNVPQ